MEFKIGQKLIISEAEFVIKAFSGDYALAGTTGANIANGGFFPIIIKKDKNEQGYIVLDDEKEVKVALEAIFTNGTMF